MNNFYWPVYKNLEKELIELSNLIHIDDDQINIYSIKVAELLLRTCIEIESISKTLYYKCGGEKPDNNKLFFDTDCINFLENKWSLSKKVVQVSTPSFYFLKIDNQILKPLYKANKHGSSSSDWLRAYQSVKHNRLKSLKKANLKNLIRAMAALYVLNIYFSNNSYFLEKDSNGLNFNSNLGSMMFSIRLHVNKENTIGFERYAKKHDFDECIYLLKITNETNDAAINKYKEILEQVNTGIKNAYINRMKSIASNIPIEEYQEIANTIFNDVTIQEMTKHVNSVKKAKDELTYEAVLNINQF